MKKLIKTVAVLAMLSVLSLGAGAVYAAPLIVNGSFETDVWPSGETDHVSPSGWVTDQSSSSYYGSWTPAGIHNTANPTYEHTPYGQQFLVLCGGECDGVEDERGYIEQTVAGFSVGQDYTLHFAQAPEHSAAAHPGEVELVQVTITGGGVLQQTFETPNNEATQYWMVWYPQSWTFTAQSSTLTFRFQGIGTGANENWEPGIDNIYLSDATAAAIPTLSEWGMIILTLLMGFAAIVIMRKQKLAV